MSGSNECEPHLAREKELVRAVIAEMTVEDLRVHVFEDILESYRNCPAAFRDDWEVYMEDKPAYWRNNARMRNLSP